jgi:hypothetical protein
VALLRLPDVSNTSGIGFKHNEGLAAMLSAKPSSRLFERHYFLTWVELWFELLIETGW